MIASIAVNLLRAAAVVFITAFGLGSLALIILPLWASRAIETSEMEFRYRAEVDLVGGTIMMELAPMFGWHSDWNRRLTIRNDGDTETIDLFEDTGWWRGSHLYLSGEHLYVLHEGQIGCRMFTFLERPRFLRSSGHSCRKDPSLAARPLPETARFPASRYYEGLRYIGRFEEGRGDQPRIRFVPASKGPEPELADLL